jgi:hypothetical protein
MQRERPNIDPDAGVADDKMAEARERAQRIKKDSGLPQSPEDGKAMGNGDDAIEDSSVSGRQPTDNEDR